MSHSEPKSAVERLAERFMSDMEECACLIGGRDHFKEHWTETWAQCMAEAQEFADEIVQEHEQEWLGWVNKVLSDQEQDRLFRKFPPP